jgi:hypothetical protein
MGRLSGFSYHQVTQKMKKRNRSEGNEIMRDAGYKI